jgi:hypothetical protein
MELPSFLSPTLRLPCPAVALSLFLPCSLQLPVVSTYPAPLIYPHCKAKEQVASGDKSLTSLDTCQAPLFHSMSCPAVPLQAPPGPPNSSQLPKCAQLLFRGSHAAGWNVLPCFAQPPCPVKRRSTQDCKNTSPCSEGLWGLAFLLEGSCPVSGRGGRYSVSGRSQMGCEGKAGPGLVEMHPPW